jgi:rSAM/selenodomain-associated transferase 2
VGLEFQGAAILISSSSRERFRGASALKISIVIPVWNEREVIPSMIDHWRQWEKEAELLFVDGGSADGSRDLLKVAGFSTMESGKCRARQMNEGAARASGDVLLFLHADTKLPSEALRLIEQGFRKGQHVWGRFDVLIEGQSRLFPLIGFMISLRSRLSGIASGDQAIFMTREAFEKVGGFPEQPLMEDIEISKRLLKLSRPLCLRERILTSGRRWEKRGVWKTIVLMWRLRLAYWLGASAHDLARYYR